MILLKEQDDEDDCLTMSQEAHSKSMVEQATALVTEMNVVQQCLEKVVKKVKEL